MNAARQSPNPAQQPMPQPTQSESFSEKARFLPNNMQ
jgi:hypothetical protein